MDMPTYKLVVVGNGGVGKTTFIRRYLTGEYEKNYIPTLGVEVHPLIFYTSAGPIRFNVYDCAGKPEFAGLGEVYWVGADCTIVMADHTESTLASVLPWLRKVDAILPNIPKVVCYNKADGHLIDKKHPVHQVAAQIRARKIMQYQISAHSNYNFEKPFLYLARQLLGDTISFVEAPAISPPVIVIPAQAKL